MGEEKKESFAEKIVFLLSVCQCLWEVWAKVQSKSLLEEIPSSVSVMILDL